MTPRPFPIQLNTELAHSLLFWDQICAGPHTMLQAAPQAVPCQQCGVRSGDRCHPACNPPAPLMQRFEVADTLSRHVDEGHPGNALFLLALHTAKAAQTRFSRMPYTLHWLMIECPDCGKPPTIYCDKSSGPGPHGRRIVLANKYRATLDLYLDNPGWESSSE